MKVSSAGKDGEHALSDWSQSQQGNSQKRQFQIRDVSAHGRRNEEWVLGAASMERG